MPIVLYRVAEANPPTVADLVSDRLRGRRQRLADETEDEWDSFSAFTSARDARRVAAFLKRRRGLPALWIVRLELPDGSGIRVFPYRGSSAHFGVSGDAVTLLAFARVVEAV